MITEVKGMSRRRVWGLCCVILIFSVVVFAQAATLYKISGKVTDSSGAAVSGVTLTCSGATATVTATSGADGKYVIKKLKAATYVVKASKSGQHFRPSERRVTVGPTATGVDFSQVGSNQAYLDDPLCGPTSGNTSTTFAFAISFVDPQDRVPTKAQLYIDGQVKNLELDSTSGHTKRYKLRMSLPAGSHKHRFRFEVGGDVLRYPGPNEDDWYHYPTVASGG
jgi:hypothetical protein